MQFLAAAATMVLFAFTVSQVSSWQGDNSHSRLGFTVVHSGIANFNGNFKNYTATIRGSNADFSDAVAELTAEVSSINTDNEARDNHLRSADFFDVEKYPALTFKSRSFKKVKDKQYKVTGDLTLHGVTKEVTLDATHNGTITNGMTKKDNAGFRVTGNIKRSDFGIATSFPTAVVSDEVALIADFEFVKD